MTTLRFHRSSHIAHHNRQILVDRLEIKIMVRFLLNEIFCIFTSSYHQSPSINMLFVVASGLLINPYLVLIHIGISKENNDVAQSFLDRQQSSKET